MIDQFPIKTHSIKQLVENLDRILAHRRKPTIIAVLGKAGIGKTWAAQWIIQNKPILAHTGKPSYVFFTIPHAPTELSIALELSSKLSERPLTTDPHPNSYTLSILISELLVRKDIKCVFADEANRLNLKCFDFIREIVERQFADHPEGCNHAAFVLIGTESLWKMIEVDRQLLDRTHRIDFLPLKQDDVIKVFLPNLDMPGWSFNPNDEEQVQQAKRLWNIVKPSLRALFDCIEHGVTDAEDYRQRKKKNNSDVSISLEEIIDDAITWYERKTGKEEYSEDKLEDILSHYTEFELRSIIRKIRKGKLDYENQKDSNGS